MARMRRKLDFRVCLAAASVVAAVAACGASTGSRAPAGGESQPAGGTAGSTATAFPTWPVPGNSVAAPLPTDAPAAVRSLAPLTGCGAELVFEPDPDVSPLPTPPWATTSTAANRQATDCLMSAWENGHAAQLVVSLISDEQDEIYTIYRLPGDGSVQVFVRVRSHADQTVAWTRTTCQALSLQEDQVTPSSCLGETPIG
jgi:hypothetical protein